MKAYLVAVVATASSLFLAACGGNGATTSTGSGGSGGGGGALASSSTGMACPPVYHFTGDLDGTPIDQAYCSGSPSITGGVQAWLFHGDFYVDSSVSQARMALRFWGAGEFVDNYKNSPLSGSIEMVGVNDASRTFYCPGPASSIKRSSGSLALTEISLTGLSKLGACPGGGSPSTDSLTIVSHVTVGGGSGSTVKGTLGGIAIDSTLNSGDCEEHDCGFTFKIGGKYAQIEIKLHDPVHQGNVSTVADEVEFASPFDADLTKDKVLYYCGGAASTVVTSATQDSGDITIKLTGLGALGACPGTPIAGSLTGKE
ncbi:MAG: hypothetical protein ABJE95_31280 [Byssovorax sp.]